MTHSEMVEILGSFAAVYDGFKVSDQKVNAWLGACGHQGVADMKRAALSYTRTEKWPPTPADINRLILDFSKTIADQMTEGEAWALLMSSISQFGSYQQDKALAYLGAASPRVAQCVAILDWKTICLWKLEDEPANRAHFWKVYLSLANRDKGADLMGVPRPAPLLKLKEPSSVKNILGKIEAIKTIGIGSKAS